MQNNNRKQSPFWSSLKSPPPLRVTPNQQNLKASSFNFDQEGGYYEDEIHTNPNNHRVQVSSAPLLDRDQVLVDGNDFIVLECIGSGYFGDVFKAIRRSNMQETVALKKIVRSQFRHHDQEGLVMKEIFILSQLNHERIVKFIGLTMVQGEEYIVTEYMAGGTLRELIHVARNSDILNGRRLSLTRAIVEGMQYLHNRTPSILHRDLTSNNILV
eukprot:TRINITY_DN6732_c0_g1_i1.p1 TRINITY_DN6732_c0_g1~~TRINITY_DN6732_c0_g1_i1.p1  ORF type:complete len:214 (-),score=44.96 TRINITY_DN6732_c0_g1_i1:484-1125(-)